MAQFDEDPDNPYDYWNRVPTDPWLQHGSSTDPAPTTTPTTPPPATAGGGSHPWDASVDPPKPDDPGDGRVYIWMGDHWGLTEPANAPYPTSNQYPTDTLTHSPYQFQDLSWPDWNPPQFQAPPAFSYADFVPPTLADAQNEPGYRFAADEGAARIQNNAAAKGNILSGGAIKNLVKWANDYATQNYNGVYGRGLQTWQANRNNAAENYMTNYGVSRDVFDRNYNSYVGGNQSARDKAKLQFQRDWDIYQADLDTKKYLAGLGNT